MEKDKTTRQRLEEALLSEKKINKISCDKSSEKIGNHFDDAERRYLYQSAHKDGMKLMRSQCLTASEELIEKEREETAIEFMDWAIHKEGYYISSRNNKWIHNWKNSNEHPLGMTTAELYKKYSDFLKGKEQ